MDFFKSVFSVQPDRDPPPAGEEAAVAALDAGPGSPGAAWVAFGGLIQTLAAKSDSVVQTYRRDLKEFGSGLRKETAAVRDAIRRLPLSVDPGSSLAQESLEPVGQAVDVVGGSLWRSATEVVSRGKSATLLPSLRADDAPDPGAGLAGGGAPKRCSWFEVQVLRIQSDPSTFTVEPEDAYDYRAWATEFPLAEKEEEMERLRAENGALDGNLARLVPHVVGYDTFWSRYFYRAHKLKQAEEARANLVKRVTNLGGKEEEDLIWEVDDDGSEEEGKEEQRGRVLRTDKPGDKQERGGEAAGDPASKEEIDVAVKPVVGENPVGKSQLGNVAAVASALSEDHDDVSSETKLDDKILPDRKAESIAPCKDSDALVMSSQPTIPEEDDLGWDEIEDLGDDDKKSGASGGGSNKIDLRKMLSTAEEDEDLSWDIEDDDEPIYP